jgi:hypothetical protein
MILTICGAGCLVYLLRKEKKHHHDFSYDCKIQVCFFSISSLNNMEFEEIRLIISKAIEQTKTHQIDLLMRWLDGILSKYRETTLGTKKFISNRIFNLIVF